MLYAKSYFLLAPNMCALHPSFYFLPWIAKHRILELKNYRVVRKTALINLSFHKWENVVQEMYSHFLKPVQTLNSGFLILSPIIFQKQKRDAIF